MRIVVSGTAVGHQERDAGRYRRRRSATVAGGASDPPAVPSTPSDGVVPAAVAALVLDGGEAREVIRERFARRRELRFEVGELQAELGRAVELEPRGTACREALDAALALASRLAELIG